jgi:glycogen debranching enzyme
VEKNFRASDWEKYLPIPVCEEHPEYEAFYKRAWSLAHDHVRDIPGMPQTPYMDEAFCDTQVWIWDTCFMTLFCKYAQEVFPGIETLNNFYTVLHGDGSLPHIIPSEKEPSWTGATPGVPNPIWVHIADNPPLFAWAEYENALYHGDLAYIRELLYERKFLQKHYDWFESLSERTLPRGVLIETCLIKDPYGFMWEGGRSGMDNTPRGRWTPTAEAERPNNPNMLWIDAISQQAFAARTIARLFALIGDKENENEWLAKFNEKKDIINRYYWDEQDGFYYDIDRRDHSFYKVVTPASFWTMTAGVASSEQARSLVRYALDPAYLGGEVPLISLSRSDPDYRPYGHYWRGSLWLPTAYASLKGLAEYGLYKEAHEAAHKIFRHMLATHEEYEPHTIWECYSPEKHEPGTQTGGIGHPVRPDFCGWSALGPIAIYLEYVLGFHTANAFEGVVEWEKPDTFRGKIGVRNFHFGDVVTDIVADEKECVVKSNAPYTLKICGKAYAVKTGENRFAL